MQGPAEGLSRRTAAIVKSMTSGVSTSGLINGLGLLYDLAGSRDGVQAARKAGATSVVVAAMNAQSSNADVARLGCGYLVCSAISYLDASGHGHSGAQDVFDAGGVAAVLRALRTHVADRIVTAVASAALCNLLGNTSSREELLGFGLAVPAALVTAMQQHPDDANVAETVTRVLALLMADTRSIGAVIEVGGVAAMISAAQRHPTVRDTVETILSVAAAIAERDLGE